MTSPAMEKQKPLQRDGAMQTSLVEPAFSGRLRLLRFPTINEARGSLTEFDYSKLPFVPQRSFIVASVPPGTVRGRHAHRKGAQVLICIQGEVTINATFEGDSVSVVLNDPSVGLFIDAEVWAEQLYHGENTALLVFASLPFDSSLYLQPD
jgi:dTDP-4-dehydrorhamnose 3,5-epimerase-like enzyme